MTKRVMPTAKMVLYSMDPVGVSPYTVAVYLSDLRHFRQAMDTGGTRFPARIMPQDVRRYVGRLRAARASASTIRRRRATLAVFNAWARARASCASSR